MAARLAAVPMVAWEVEHLVAADLMVAWAAVHWVAAGQTVAWEPACRRMKARAAACRSIESFSR